MPNTIDPLGSVHDLVVSGARGSMEQLTRMAGMKGLVQNTQGVTLEFPITTSYKEGLTPIEYFVTTHGSRKGLADTALQTAKAGYLTRKLFDVAQDAIITEEDCGVKEGVLINRMNSLGIEVELGKNIKGRTLLNDLTLPDGKVFKRNHYITALDAREIEKAGIEELEVRSPMSCQTLYGLCRKCYGADLTTWEEIDFGEAVGTVAAQAIGEPGTQLTMNTKHAGGGAAAQGDVVQGLPRVEEVFERRSPKNPATVAQIDGTIGDIQDNGTEMVIHLIPDKDAKTARKKQIEYSVVFPRKITVKKGDHVNKGDLMSDGTADLTELFKFAGRERTQEYIINEAGKIYELQGVTISRKHIEVVVKQMFSRKKIKDTGDTHLNIGDVVEEWFLSEVNGRITDAGGAPAVGEPHLLGITEVSLTRQSFLSAASFQNTTKSLINASIRGTQDRLRGLKENVIIGRLIPAGTGYEGSKKFDMIEDLQEEYKPAFTDESVAFTPVDEAVEASGEKAE